MNLDEYRHCLNIAKRHARNAADAEDLLHAALLVAIDHHRISMGDGKDRAWLAGVLRKLAAMEARTAVRRRGREQRWAEQPTDPETRSPGEAPSPEAVLGKLSEGARRVAVLVLHGLNPDEICYVLGLKPAAFRQRLTALRRQLGKLPPALHAEAVGLAYARPRREGEERLDFGLIRRALMHHVGAGSDIGTHDPDGHLVGIRTR